MRRTPLSARTSASASPASKPPTSAAPATGTPEVGGLLAGEALALVRALSGVRLIGFDVVEVCPPYDGPGQITSLLAANLAYEMLSLAALDRISGR